MSHEKTNEASGISDAIVLGAGAAGLTAALFLRRSGRSVVLVDELMGNHMTNAATVENFPGFPDGVPGPELSALLQQQAMAAGAQFSPATATGIKVEEGGTRVFHVITSSGTQDARTVLVCVGSSLRLLGVQGETELEGKGVSHCATCDGPLFQDRPVAVIGGGDSALDEALVLSEFASQVTVIHRGDSLAAQSALRDRIHAAANITVLPRTEVVRLEGDGRLQALVARDVASGVETALGMSGVFTFVGLEPNTTFLQELVEMDGGGHVVTDTWMRTSTAGLFAAGDIRQHSAAQFVSAAGDGATAAIAAHRFLESDSRSSPDDSAAGGRP